MVRKKDDSFRFCIDYRRVNAITIKNAFPVPMLRSLSIVSAVLNTLLLLTYYQDTGNWECQTEPASVLLSVHVEDFSSLLECLLA